MDGIAPPTQEVGCGIVWWNGHVCILLLSKLCCISCGLPVVSQKFVKMGIPEERNGAVVGVPLPSGLASGTLGTLNIHLWL